MKPLVLVTPLMVVGTGCALAVMAALRNGPGTVWGAAAVLLVVGLAAWVVSS